MIRIHRFDNNAPSSLLNHSHSGFLSPAPSIFECLDANMSAKGMRISVSTEEELGSSMERKDAADDFGEPVVRGEEGFLSSVLKLHIFMVGIWEIDELGCLIICCLVYQRTSESTILYILNILTIFCCSQIIFYISFSR
ncbi:uncharacterized protein LOC113757936 [Coffea eugenioides]|uniref:uncharacterized protein LOC113757936 n=1 Tax=Coffea eugenioides TaxID=49369 RepID=UPI000F607FF3|nr:uncharacterized protein LOC113757936 [Coffea eugenioides]